MKVYKKLLYISLIVLFMLCNKAVSGQTSTAFYQQPTEMNMVSGESVRLSAKASNNDATIYYRWYQTSKDNSSTDKLLSKWSEDSDIEIPFFSEIEIRYFYCQAASDTTDMRTYAVSKKASVAHTGLPTLYINTVNNEEPTAEYIKHPTEETYGDGVRNATKVPAKMEIFTDEYIYPVYNSGEYVKKQSGLTVKIRGNTSATYSNKKPFKLKLQKKADLLAKIVGRDDPDYQDKEWYLLRDGWTINAFVGLEVADIVGVGWTPDYAYVDVFVNGDYRGVYILTEAISRCKNRINISKDGYIIERDAYWWNEDVKFITDKYDQKYTFKYPDEDEISDEQIQYITDYMNTLENNISGSHYEDYIDKNSFARWILTHDILGTWDGAGSNIFMYKYDNTDTSKIFMSSPWDFDSNYMIGSEDWASQHFGMRGYYDILFQHADFYEYYRLLWHKLSDNLIEKLSEQFANLRNNYAENINLAREYDATRWEIDYKTVEYELDSAMQWFEERRQMLNTQLANAWSYGRTIYLRYPPNSHFEIFNMSGQLIMRSETKSDFEQITMSKPGIYLLKIRYEKYKLYVN